MKLPIYQVDAFTDVVFGGNPAAVVPLTSWLDDATMQGIAMENNLSETAFIVQDGDGYAIRWFTPTTEVGLCGHATLASAHVVLERLEPDLSAVTFMTRRHGTVSVARKDEHLSITFPRFRPQQRDDGEEIVASLGAAPESLLFAHDNWFAVYGSEAEVGGLSPDFVAMKACAEFGVIATAPGNDDIHFVSRYFVPSAGVDEDPVTGSTHCALIPYWAERLGVREMNARQISARGGRLVCTDDPDVDRVRIAGASHLYLEGTINI